MQIRPYSVIYDIVDDMKKAAELLETTYAYARKRKANCMAKLVALVRQDPEYSQLFND